MNTQTNPQPINLVAQEDKRLFIPEDNPLREQLMALFTNPDFQYVKAGLDHYEIPYWYDSKASSLFIGAKDNPHRYIIGSGEIKDTTSYSRIVFDGIMPRFRSLLLSAANKTFREMNEAFEAYQRLHQASLAYDGNSNYEADINYAKLWDNFGDLVTLAVYTFRNDEVKIVTVGKDGYTFGIQFQNGGQTNCIEFDLRTKGGIFLTFDKIRAYYFWHHVTVTWRFETTEQIVRDYHQIANQHVCCLTFTTAKNPITLFAVNDDKVISKSYQADPHKPHNLYELMHDIKECPLGSEMEDADTLVNQLIKKALTIQPDTTITIQELFND